MPGDKRVELDGLRARREGEAGLFEVEIDRLDTLCPCTNICEVACIYVCAALCCTIGTPNACTQPCNSF